MFSKIYLKENKHGIWCVRLRSEVPSGKRDINSFSSRPLTSLDNGALWEEGSRLVPGSSLFPWPVPFYWGSVLAPELAKANMFRGLRSGLKVRIPHSHPSHKVTF